MNDNAGCFEDYTAYASIQMKLQENNRRKKHEETIKQKTRLVERSTHHTVSNALRCESMCPCPMFVSWSSFELLKEEQMSTKYKEQAVLQPQRVSFVCFSNIESVIAKSL